MFLNLLTEIIEVVHIFGYIFI